MKGNICNQTDQKYYEDKKGNSKIHTKILQKYIKE